ncbi:uncharacterized protein TRIADDRAFT_21737 [Trichoplax adhaerens]|uniref:3-oxoacyl-[acyl-carrier-protein] synthase n=1 Tax=Trichoplax adhaerens TaxID=10228 RepID=B3RPJ3_TRIAD|nr:hypothetical protein TRIADDRAFT_21737 [Trichoplax adhaerens]EDV28198.1 hypothetical protein TRIADDRAFT_21737 [Trichoplax adhaerens]|eukprot:XP_002110032.1 hypothetical protein TRIADDRAFT_21737 [Trichoplax adhaerens]
MERLRKGSLHTTRLLLHGRKLSTSVNISSRRVVVTGLGLVTPLGVGTEIAWKRLVDGACGITSIDSSLVRVIHKMVGRVPRGEDSYQFKADDWIGRGDKLTMTEGMIFAIAAAQQALKDADWMPENEEDRERTGVCIGTGMAGLDDISNTSSLLNTQGYRKVSPYFVPRILINMAAGHVSMKFGFQGPNHAVSTACTTGAHAIGDGFRFIKYGDADVIVAGGSEASISPLSIAGFCRARALSTKYNNCPSAASRPFDRDRDGFVMGEGAGILVLEEYSHAKKRNANIYAEILGYGLSGDAFHITSGRPDGKGALLCMERALREASININKVKYINAHATSTPVGDAIENKAIKSLFGSNSKALKVSSNKGSIGHLLGAAGAVEAIFTILAIKHSIAPPTLNLHNLHPEKDFDLNYVPLQAQELTANNESLVALTNSFGFGGTNASLCFSSI